MRKSLPLASVLAILAFALSAKAAIILNLEGFTKGDVAGKGRGSALSALRFDLVVTSAHEANGAPTGKITHRPLIVTRDIDASSPALFEACLTNQDFKSLTLELVKPEGQGKEIPYYSVKLTSVVISGVRQYVDEKTGAGMEDVSFSYEKIEVLTPGESSTPAETPAKRPGFRLPGK